MSKDWKFEFVHVDEIRAGDIIDLHGQDMTVCKKDIVKDTFMGVRIFGENYRSSRQIVKRYLLRK